MRRLDRHGTIAEPHERLDGVKTRQTTIAVPDDLDLQLQTYFFHHGRKRFRSKTELWCAAMRLYLSQHNGEALARDDSDR